MYLSLKLPCIQFQVPHTPKGEKWYFCAYCAPGVRWGRYHKEDDFYRHAHISAPKKIKTKQSGDSVPMDVTEEPVKLIVTYKEGAALFQSGKDLPFEELAEKVL